MRRIIVLVVSVLALVLGASPRVQAEAFPELIALPDGFQPEGIASGRGATVYVGSLANGSIYRANVRTGEGTLAVPPQADRVAVGLKFDARTNYLFVAGGEGGAGYVYNANTGARVAAYQFSATSETFVNDVVITRDAAYFTDSGQPVLYVVPLDEKTGRLSNQQGVRTIPLGGDFEFVPGAFNSNGIAAAENGRFLIVVNSTTGTLYRIRARTGEVRRIDLGGATVERGDGILLIDRTLYVVQNRLNQIAVVRLNPDLDKGTITGVITDADFDVPTTIASVGQYLYAVNARFGTPPTPDTDYAIVRVARTP